MGTLANQAEIGVWVQTPGRFCGGQGLSSPEQFLILYKKHPTIQCILGRKMVRNAVHNAFLSTLTTGTAFLRVPFEMTPRLPPYRVTGSAQNTHDNDDL